ncbi:MAG: SLC13 family permease [Aeromonadaceae bacterium]|nr:SLC13 family permease [Aeromonadaceae bacterium]
MEDARSTPLHLPLFGLAMVLLLGLRVGLPFTVEINSGLAILVTIGLLWLTEAIPLTITALLVPVLAVLLGVFPLKEALSEFANPILYLFLGGFTLAAALAHQGLDTLLAQRVLLLARGRLDLGALLLFLISAGLSMWISNTATTAMMMPLAMGLAHRLDPEQDRPTLVFLLLGVAYSASIGGIGTLVGSPPNAIAAAQLGMSFTDWLLFGLPVVVLLWPVAILLLWWGLKPRLKVRFELEQTPLVWTSGRRLTLLIFALTVLGWIFSAPLSGWLGGIAQFDSLIALLAVVAVAVSGVARWQDINQATDWGILLLFGGGLTLSAVLSQTGTSAFLADQIALALQGAHPFAILLLLAAFVVFLTELTSNTATAALLIPLFISVAVPLQVSPVVMAVLIAVGASCAFMLPVATPPNAIVFASGLIRQREMMRVGLRLNLVFSILLACLAYFVGDVLA